MKKYSVDNYNLRSRLTDNEIKDRLNSRTLKKKYLTMESTEKDFIGRIQDDKFEIFHATFFPYGAACVLQGTIKTSDIKLTTTLHKGFRILFMLWVAAMTVLFLVTWILDSAKLDTLLIFILWMPIGVLFFRLFLHVAYVLARNNGLQKMKHVLEINHSKTDGRKPNSHQQTLLTFFKP
jgi:hypothetical protein